MLGSLVAAAQKPAACLPNDDYTQKDKSYDQHAEDDVATLFRDRFLRREKENGGEQVHRRQILVDPPINTRSHGRRKPSSSPASVLRTLAG